MKLTIITVNYNNKAGLEKTAISINSQTCHDFEWIIIDGGSKDGSKEVIETLYRNHNTNISYWCSESDKGIYNAMNKGITHAKGTYVNFMNSGDTFCNEHVLEDMIPYLTGSKADVLYGNVSNEYTDHSELKTFPQKLSFRWLYNDTINHQASFCKLEKLKKFMFDETLKIMADRKLWLQLYTHGCSFKHAPLTMVCYDHTGDTWTSGEAWLKDFCKLHDEFIPAQIQNNFILSKIYKMGLEIVSRIRRL